MPNQRTAIVTGAGAGIGRAVATRLAAAAYDVGLFDLNERGMRDTATDVRALGRTAIEVVGNVALREDVARAALTYREHFPTLDVLVNNAGILRTAKFLEMSERDWSDCLAINLNGMFHFCRAVLPSMVQQRSGCIINMASWTGKKGVANHAAYGASKAAIISVTQSLAEEFGEYGIRVNAVCPGIIVDTDMRTQAEDLNRAQGLPDVHTRSRSLPLRRPGYPGEIADVVAFLASDAAAYITGESVNVTGGLWMD
jgi:NAD(P)-dependent dehydrogenase (short-subunit alcohol dehydrogenase family)